MNDLSVKSFMTIPEAAELIGVSVGTFRNMLSKQRPFDQYRVGHRIYLLREQVEEEVQRRNEGLRKPYKTRLWKGVR